MCAFGGGGGGGEGKVPIENLRLMFEEKISELEKEGKLTRFICLRKCEQLPMVIYESRVTYKSHL